MTLRDDVRDYFEREGGRFPTPAGLRAGVIAEAAREGAVDEHPQRWAAVVAVLLGVALVGGLVATGAIRNLSTRQVTHGGPSPKPTPPINQSPKTNGWVWDADLVDASTGWALQEQCSADKCQYTVSSTADGGITWSAPTKVGPVFASTNGDAPRHIHFVTRTDGFVYGNGVAFVTHNGGQTWGATGLKVTEVVAIEGFGPVWAVTYSCAKGVQCPYEVHVSYDLGKTWLAAAPLPIGFAPRGAVAFSGNGLLLQGFGVGDMTLTKDGGVTWTTVAGRCAPNSDAGYIATSDGTEFWQACTRFYDPTLTSEPPISTLFVSLDGGATWAQRGAFPRQSVPVGLVPTSSATCFLVDGIGPIQVTHDAGRSWTPVTIQQGFASIGFAVGGGQAWALDKLGAIWASHDGGMTWAPLNSMP